MTRSMKIVAPLALILLATACGGAAGASSSNAPLTAQSVADKIGCASFARDTSFELYVADGGDCTLNGDTVHVRAFASNTTRDNWLKVAGQFGGPFDVFDRALAYGEKPETLTAIKAKAGGTIRS